MIYLPVAVRMSVRPSAPFPIDNECCIHFVIRDEWYGIVDGQNPSV